MLIAAYREDPSSDCLAMHSLGLPRTSCLLRSGLVFCRHALVGSATSVAHQVASDHFIPRQLGASSAAAVGARLDDLVALFRDAVVEVLHQLFVRRVDGRVRYRDGLEDAKHGDRSRDVGRVGRWGV